MLIAEQNSCQPPVEDAATELLTAMLDLMAVRDWEPEDLLAALGNMARRIARAREEASAPEEKVHNERIKGANCHG